MLGIALVVAITAGFCVFVAARSFVGHKSDAWMVFLGSGGHTGEMMRLLANMSTRPAQLLVVYGQGDAMSQKRAQSLDAKTFTVPRARKVGQGWVSTVFSSIYSLYFCLGIVAKTNPRLLLVNGPGTCVIIAACVLALKPLGIQTKIVYVESLARVSTLSLSGRLLYPVADALVVQWPQLAEKYPKAKYIGMLV